MEDKNRKTLKIEFLYYDKTDCSRCCSTDKSVEQSLKELKKALDDKKLKVELEEKKLPESKIHLSPSILIDGKDIERIFDKNSKPKSNVCAGCCRLAGHTVSCRTFTYKGKSYDHIPKEMVLEAINKSLS